MSSETLPTNLTLEAFLKACLDFKNTVDEVSLDSYDVKAVGTWSVISLLGHVFRGLASTLTYLNSGQSDVQPQVRTAEEFYSAVNLKDPKLLDRVEMGGINEGELSRDNLVIHFEEIVEKLQMKLFDVDLKAVIVIMNEITIPVEEYLKIRTVELTVHLLDLCTALGLKFRPSTQALKVCVEVMVGCSNQYEKMINLVAALSGRQFDPKELSIF